MKQGKFPDIFRYTDYRKFLNDCYLYKKKVNRHFTLRYFAQKAGLKSHCFIKEVIDGKHNLTEKNIHKVVIPFNLTKGQTEYFCKLVHFNQAKGEEDKNRFFSEMVKLQKVPKSQTITASQYIYYSDWFNTVVRAIVTLENFKDDPEWIAAKINPKVTPAQVKKALKLLLKMGFLKRNKDGKLVQSAPRLEIDPGVSTLSIKNFNRSMIDLGREAIGRYPQDKREVSGATISISEEGYRHIKEMVRKFKKDVGDFVTRDSRPAKLVCQLNFQLFPLTDGQGKDE